METEQFKKIHENTRRMCEAYINSIILPMQIYAKQMEALFAPIQKIISKIDIEKIAKLKERLDNIEKSDFEYKWLISIPIPFGDKLMALYEKGKNEEVNKFLIDLFRGKENIESFKEWLKGKPAYEKRKQIIDDCLKAHLEKKFTLSIPVLLAQCDGIIINHVKKKLKYTKKEKPDMRKVAKEKRIDINKYLARQLIKIYESKRIEILHGMNPYYFKNKKGYGEELSVKAIWTLFEIINFARKIE